MDGWKEQRKRGIKEGKEGERKAATAAAAVAAATKSRNLILALRGQRQADLSLKMTWGHTE